MSGLSEAAASDSAGSSTPTKNSSHNRRHVPRRSTMGPLEAEDPLSAQSSPLSKSPRQALVPERKALPAAPRSQSRSPALPISVIDTPKRDFSFLIRRDNFHSLSDSNIPLAFRESLNYRTEDSSIQQLLDNGRFQSAAVLAAEQLTAHTDTTDHTSIFSLFFTRLACLQLAGLHDIAAQESKALQDLNAPIYMDESTSQHLVPWELRIIAVRLQALGFTDWRRGVTGYYDLAREARLAFHRAAAASDAAAQQMWRDRLADLGMRVANALLEMGDDDGARRHLSTLADAKAQSPAAQARLALVHLRAGDVAAARRCVQTEFADSDAPSAAARAVEALSKMADGDFAGAADDWRELQLADRTAGIATVAAQNLAVCLLFIGQLDQARELLENETAQADHTNHTATFNLATIYELCSERSAVLKLELAAKMAAHEPRSTGWEFANADFKL